MLEFIRSLRRNGTLAYQLPAMAAAFLIAEFFYKFRSFALECLGFLATWYLIDLGVDVVRKLITRTRVPASPQ
jgi:hypothetical protein